MQHVHYLNPDLINKTPTVLGRIYQAKSSLDRIGQMIEKQIKVNEEILSKIEKEEYCV